MPESTKHAIKLAVLQFPEAFGLKDEDVNPILAFTLLLTEADTEILDHESVLKNFLTDCETKVNAKVQMLLTALATMPDLPTSPDIDQTDESGNGKPKPSTKDNGGKISNKQLRYIGYLQHQLGKKPDYDAIGGLSQKAATMRIKDLEKELKQSK